MRIAAKLARVVIYREGLPPIKPHDSLTLIRLGFFRIVSKLGRVVLDVTLNVSYFYYD